MISTPRAPEFNVVFVLRLLAEVVFVELTSQVRRQDLTDSEIRKQKGINIEMGVGGTSNVTEHGVGNRMHP